MIDVHCHLLDLRFEKEIENLVVITNGTDLESSKKAVELAGKYPNVYACVGIHPENIDLRFEIGDLRKLTKSPKVVGIGEIGLDYRFETGDRDRERQRFLFEELLKLAVEMNLPVQIHNRGADEDILTILTTYNSQLNGILMHCFTRGVNFMEKMSELGAYFSFGGMITKKNNTRMQKVAKLVPEDKLLLETDSSYSDPTEVNVKITAKRLAEIRGITVEEIHQITTQNTLCLFSRMKTDENG